MSLKKLNEVASEARKHLEKKESLTEEAPEFELEESAEDSQLAVDKAHELHQHLMKMHSKK